jgi:hypothetical protein
MPHAYVHPACKHPMDQRTVVNGKVHCAACGRTYTSPRSPVRHGTTRGFSKHKRLRRQSWTWPVLPGTCGCIEAIRDYQRERRMNQIKVRRIRDAARQAALLDLRRQFPGEYQRHYGTELALRELTQFTDPPPACDDLMTRLLGLALDRDEHDVHQRVRDGRATPRERELLRLTYRLRALLSERPGVIL